MQEPNEANLGEWQRAVFRVLERIAAHRRPEIRRVVSVLLVEHGWKVSEYMAFGPRERAMALITGRLGDGPLHSVPALSDLEHLCRKALEEAEGPDTSMRDDAVRVLTKLAESGSSTLRAFVTRKPMAQGWSGGQITAMSAYQRARSLIYGYYLSNIVVLPEKSVSGIDVPEIVIAKILHREHLREMVLDFAEAEATEALEQALVDAPMRET